MPSETIILQAKAALKRGCVILCFLLLSVIITGCSKNEPVFDPEQDPDEQAGRSVEVSLPDNPVLFDFAELPEDDFPRGMWSINQLIEKYGPVETIEANYWPEPGYELVFVNVSLKDIGIIFGPQHVSGFSFYKDVGEPVPNSDDVQYDLNESDKNIKLEIIESTSYDSKLVFPHGIKIGQSMKSDVLAAYPENTAEIYKEEYENDDYFVNSVSYYYDFSDKNGKLPEWDPPRHGGIDYQFDKADVLRAVNILWRWLTL